MGRGGCRAQPGARRKADAGDGYTYAAAGGSIGPPGSPVADPGRPRDRSSLASIDSDSC